MFSIQKQSVNNDFNRMTRTNRNKQHFGSILYSPSTVFDQLHIMFQNEKMRNDDVQLNDVWIKQTEILEYSSVDKHKYPNEHGTGYRSKQKIQ